LTAPRCHNRPTAVPTRAAVSVPAYASHARADEYERYDRMLHDFAALVVAAVLGAILLALL